MEIGKSLCDSERLDFAKDTLKKAADMGVKILLPVDSVVASAIDASDTETVSSDNMPADKMGLDIGPETVKCFVAALDGAKSILWNGPMGVFEDPKFAEGTKKLAEAVAEMTQKHGTISVIGGGDTASAVRQFKVADKVSHVSTGGGASLEYCEGKKLPGMEPFRV